MTDPLTPAQNPTAVPRVLTSTPPNLPLEVRLSFWRYLFISRMREMSLAVPFGILMLALGAWLAFAADETGENDVLIGLSGIALGLFLLASTPISAKRQLKDGFSVGADNTGVYLRPFMDKNRVVFVPWECVEAVRVGRWMGPQLVVKPRDTVVEGQFALVGKGGLEARAGTAIAQRRRIARLGTNIHAPIPGVNKEELLNNLRYYAAGRAPVATL